MCARIDPNAKEVVTADSGLFAVNEIKTLSEGVVQLKFKDDVYLNTAPVFVHPVATGAGAVVATYRVDGDVDRATYSMVVETFMLGQDGIPQPKAYAFSVLVC